MTRRAADGEAEFARLFEEFSAPIYNYVLRMVGDPDRAADITQDTFIKAYRKLHTVTEATSTRSWLYRIATNTAIDDMRRRRMVTPMGDDAPTYANRADQRPGPEAQVHGRHARRARPARPDDACDRTTASASCSATSRT